MAYFGSKIISKELNIKFIKSFTVFFFGILMLNIFVIRQSVYWTTGSFNYVYPLFLLFWYWHVLLKNSKENFKGKKLFFTSILAFFASATVEQGGMMAFGLTVLFFLYKFFDNSKNKIILRGKNMYQIYNNTNSFINWNSKCHFFSCTIY